VDANHDGVSQPEELLTLSQAGIDRIDLTSHAVRRRDGHGNIFRYRASVRFANGKRGTMWDVYLKVVLQ
jgi:hypothetical protein